MVTVLIAPVLLLIAPVSLLISPVNSLIASVLLFLWPVKPSFVLHCCSLRSNCKIAHVLVPWRNLPQVESSSLHPPSGCALDGCALWAGNQTCNEGHAMTMHAFFKRQTGKAMTMHTSFKRRTQTVMTFHGGLEFLEFQAWNSMKSNGNINDISAQCHS